MSRDTKIDLRQLFIYQVYVRNFSEAGTFQGVIDELDRIQALGVDIVYLLPIHEIGEKNRKGGLGSPYSIKDYYSINKELGTLEDFKKLVDEIHQRDMKIMLDIVFNHTSYDSVLLKDHPEYFYRNELGEFSNRVGDWWDITDFDYTLDKGLWTYLIDNLLYWTNLGVDGYRFDVASFLPLEFLEEAKDAVKAIDPDTIWLSESVHGGFLKMFRDEGFEALSEGEIYQVFDMAYDYDTHNAFEAYLKGEGKLTDYVDWMMRQEEIYPKNYVKLRNLENHDFGRIAGYLNEDHDLLVNWHAFSFFNKGATMIFNGGEYSDPKHPDLFDKDVINKTGRDLSELIKLMTHIVKDPLFSEGVYTLTKAASKDVMVGRYRLPHRDVLGIFNVGKEKGKIKVPIEDGTYSDYITGENIKVLDGTITLSNHPMILDVK